MDRDGEVLEARSSTQVQAESPARPLLSQDQARKAAIAEMIREEPFLLSVVGDCMAPILRHGQQVRVAQRSPHVGDVVAVSKEDGSLLIHRYLLKRPVSGVGPGRSSWLIVTKPDEGTRFDPELPQSALLGVVTDVVRADQAATASGDEEQQQSLVPFRASFWQRVLAVSWAARYLARRSWRWTVRAVGAGPDPKAS